MRKPAGKALVLTTEQMALIHVARRDRQLADDEYRQLLMAAAGVSSSTALDVAGFERTMARFKTIGFVHRPAGGRQAASALPKRAFGQRPGMATPPQVELIQDLWKRWHGKHDENALNAWIAGHFGVSNLRFVTVKVAQMLIEALKSMTARQAAKEQQS